MACFGNAIIRHSSFIAAGLLTLSSTAFAGAGVIHDTLKRVDANRAVSSLQVVDFVNTKYADKGRGVGFSKSPKEGFPDCYIVRLMTHEGLITILKINCQ